MPWNLGLGAKSCKAVSTFFNSTPGANHDQPAVELPIPNIPTHQKALTLGPHVGNPIGHPVGMRHGGYHRDVQPSKNIPMKGLRKQKTHWSKI